MSFDLRGMTADGPADQRADTISDGGAVSLGGELAAKRDGWSVPISELRPTDTVAVNGVETTVEVAASLGLIAKDVATGQWRKANAAEDTARTASEQQREREREGREHETREQREEDESLGAKSYMDAAVEARLQQVYSRAPDEATGVAMDLIENGETAEVRKVALASRLGLSSPEMVDTLTRTAMDAYRSEAIEMAAHQTGADRSLINEAFEHAGRNGLGRDAMTRHFNEGRADYSGVVESYLLHTAESDADRWVGAEAPDGYGVRRGRDGKLVFVSPEGEMALDAAIRQRRVSIKGGTL